MACKGRPKAGRWREVMRRLVDGGDAQVLCDTSEDRNDRLCKNAHTLPRPHSPIVREHLVLEEVRRLESRRHFFQTKRAWWWKARASAQAKSNLRALVVHTPSRCAGDSRSPPLASCPPGARVPRSVITIASAGPSCLVCWILWVRSSGTMN